MEEWSGRWLKRKCGGGVEERRRRALLLDGQAVNDEELVLDAIRLGAVYKVHNRCRHGGRCKPAERINMLTQAAYDMADGCRFAMQCLDQRFRC